MDRELIRRAKALHMMWRRAQSNCNWELADEIQKKIVELNLPKEKCGDCGVEMSFFEYHANQGYCKECTDKMVEKLMNEEWYKE